MKTKDFVAADLIKKLQTLEGLTNDERSNLIGLLRQHKKYGLVWEDKPEDVEERLREELPVLREVKEKAIIGTPLRGGDGGGLPNHILIEGDNLEALTALSYTHEGKIDVIYIDPPYNTGNKDFVYNDSFVDSEDSYRHSKWLSFMNKRLKIAKKLLSDKGVIFISIDDNEQANLKLLCDEVFMERLFVTDLIWRSSDSSNHDSKKFSIDYNHTLVYSKNVEWQPLKIGRTEDDNTHYKNPDNDPNGPWFPSNVQSPNPRANLMFDIISPQGHAIHPPKNGWRWSREKMQEYIDAGVIIFPDGGTRLVKKTYLKDQQGIVPSNIWWDIERTGHNRNAKYELKKIFQELKTSDVFSTPKPTKFIKRIFEISSYQDSIILDFFAGSGTTLHATMQLNAEDGGHRQCILVTNNENNICEEVTYERNKRVIQGYTTPKGVKVEGLKQNTLRYYKTDFIPRDRTQKNMRALVAAATDLLCIKEDLYEEQKTFGRFTLKPHLVRYFNDGRKHMLIVYHEELIDEIVEEIKCLPLTPSKGEGNLKIYVFSPGRYAFTDNFREVGDKVELVALPAAIYDAYQKVLPKRKEKLFEEEKQETEFPADLFEGQGE